jgi:HTH-type transcriptional regulator / antitoxin HigA
MTVSMRKPSEPVTAFPVRDAEDLAKALVEIGNLLDAQPGSAGEARLEVLSVLVRDYEARHYPIPPPDTVEAIKFRLEQQGLTSKALEGVIGSRTRVFEVLNRKRPLSLRMIRNLHDGFGIPYESLLGTGGQPRLAPSQPTNRPRRDARAAPQATATLRKTR